jgi:hypothetical protein
MQRYCDPRNRTGDLTLCAYACSSLEKVKIYNKHMQGNRITDASYRLQVAGPQGITPVTPLVGASAETPIHRGKLCSL